MFRTVEPDLDSQVALLGTFPEYADLNTTSFQKSVTSQRFKKRRTLAQTKGSLRTFSYYCRKTFSHPGWCGFDVPYLNIGFLAITKSMRPSNFPTQAHCSGSQDPCNE